MNKLVISGMEPVLGSNTVMLVAENDFYEYSATKERGKRLGTTYHVINAANGSVQTVKVTDPKPLVSENEIKASLAKFEPLLISFTNFTASLYSTRDTNEVKFSCTAESAEIIDREVIL